MQEQRPEFTWAGAGRLILLTAALTLLLGMVMTFQLLPGRYQFHEGEVATFNVKSPARVEYVSQIASKNARDQAADAIPLQLEYDPLIGSQQLSRLDAALRQVSEVRKQRLSVESGLDALNKIDYLELEPGAARRILQCSESEWLVLGIEARRVLNMAMGAESTAEQSAEMVRKLSTAVDPSFPAEYNSVVVDLVEGFIRPTVIVDQEATDAARENARAAVRPVRVTVEKGEIVLRDGDVVRNLDLEKLEAVGLTNPQLNWYDAIGYFLLALVLALLLNLFLMALSPATWASSRRLVLVYTVLVLALLAAKMTVPGRGLWAYLFPIAAVPMILTMLTDHLVAAIVIVGAAPLMGLMSGASLEIASASLMGGLTGILGMRRLERQSHAFFTGLIVAAATFAVVFSFKLWTQDTDLSQLGLIAFICAVNGLLSAILTLGASTVLGHLFGVTTSTGLLELAHPSQPLFRRLLSEAPGTYHHSVVVANLSERAAQLVGADPLLARVGSYYHDVGKVVRPYCFVENQFEGENIHDKLNPQTSARLIIAHVKDGLELAAQQSLPSKVRDIMEQHHGTKLAAFFYRSACEEHSGGRAPNQADFRYAGPKPQSKEAGIVLLADSVEATVRASDDHSPDAIDTTVRRIINETVLDGQLDECPLSIQDLATIRETFVSVLQGIFHPRIKYPEPAELEAIGGANAARITSSPNRQLPERSAQPATGSSTGKE